MRTLPLLAALLILTACGFIPLYGSQTTSMALAGVSIDNLPEREGQKLRLLLSDRFYGTQPPQVAQYRLAVTLNTSKEDLGIRSDDVATRARRGAYATFSLIPQGSTTAVLSGTERSFAGYNIFIDPYATEAAEQDALERTLVQVADQLTNRVALYLAAHPPSSSEAIGRNIMPQAAKR